MFNSDSNNINFLEPKKRFSWSGWKLRKYFRKPVLVVFMLAIVIAAQSSMVQVLANVENLKFTISHLGFG
ncbi:MAG: hypothetical protein Q8Q23_05840, partial [bacterium]|nr:hypothetical protein [bacterium]